MAFCYLVQQDTKKDSHLKAAVIDNVFVNV